MIEAQKPSQVSLNRLIEQLKEGEYVIPNFQRDFEWKPKDINALMKSIFSDYYVGSLLLWRSTSQNRQDLSCEPIRGHPGGGKPIYVVLDGQQRLTALYYAFVAPKISLPALKTANYFFMRVDRYMAGEEEDAFDYGYASLETTKLLSDPTAQFRRHIFPFQTIGAGPLATYKWALGYIAYWASEAEKALPESALAAAVHAAKGQLFAEKIEKVIGQYQIAYVELDRELDIEKVCNIFTQINSQGVRLDTFNLLNALLVPKGLQLKQLYEAAQPRLGFVNSQKMDVYILQVMSILRQSYCSAKFLFYLLPGAERPVRDEDGRVRLEVQIGSVEDFEALWNQAVDALELAIRRLSHPQEYGVSSAKYLPYVAILPVFSALMARVDALPANDRLNGGRKLRHWYWASIYTNRFSGAVESKSAKDFQEVLAWLSSEDAEPAVIAEFKTRAASFDFRTEVKRGTSTYNGIFNLLVLAGARDWITGNIPQPDELDDHHIVPASWGAKHVPGQFSNSILNRTPLTAETNRAVINDRLPNAYLPELIAGTSRAQVEVIMASHFISPSALDILLHDPFTPADFEAFVAERQKSLTAAIISLLVQERLELSPDLRALDERMQKIELGLRAAVVSASNGDAGRIPSHVIFKVDERVKGELKKNPGLDAGELRTLAGRLQYADLREVEESLVGVGLWPTFETWFGAKPALSNRFNQLAGLRNSIRHSRTVTPVTLMDGEAAIHWFEDILKARAA